MPMPELILPPQGSRWPPDPVAFPEAYRGVTLRRMFAYILDAWVIILILFGLKAVLALAALVTFGLLWPLHFLIVPMAIALAYHSLQMASPMSATIGMRVFGLRVYSILGGGPTLAQAAIHTICFYATLGLSGGVLLLVALFNPQRRTIHDFLAGMVVLRKVVV